MAVADKKELSWVNYIKVLCMVLVFLNHSETYSGYRFFTARHLYSPLFVNAFFVVSGYLLFKKQLATDIICQTRNIWMNNGGGEILLKNILYKIAIPSILFASILFLPKKLIRGQGFEMESFLNDTILGGSMWFTCALTVAELLLLVSLLSRFKTIWFYLLCGMITAFCSCQLFAANFAIFPDPHVPWYYKSGMSAVLFLAFGGVYWKYEHVVDKFFSRWMHLPLICILLIYIGVCLFKSNSISGNLYRPLNLPTCGLVVIGSYCLIRISKWLPANTIVNYWGRHSIGLYFLSGALPNTMAVVLKNLIPVSTGLSLVTWVSSLLIAVPIVYVINHYMPFMYDLRLINKSKG